MVTVNWTERALQALDAIHDYIAQDAPLYAERFVRQIIGAVDRLEKFPLSGRQVPEAERPEIREVIFQHYRIIYWLASEERIDILIVLHGSRDLTHTDSQPWDAH